MKHAINGSKHQDCTSSWFSKESRIRLPILIDQRYHTNGPEDKPGIDGYAIQTVLDLDFAFNQGGGHEYCGTKDTIAELHLLKTRSMKLVFDVVQRTQRL